MKPRIVAAAHRRTITWSSPAPAQPGCRRQVPATASSVICSPAGVNIKSASRAGNTVPSAASADPPGRCQRHCRCARPQIPGTLTGRSGASTHVLRFPRRAFLRFPVCPPGSSPSSAFLWFPFVRRSPLWSLRPLPGSFSAGPGCTSLDAVPAGAGLTGRMFSRRRQRCCLRPPHPAQLCSRRWCGCRRAHE